MKQILIGLMALSLSTCSSVKKNTSSFYSGILRDRTGLAGCNWIIQLTEKLPDGTEFLEPVNLQDYLQQPHEGKKISFSYDRSSYASTCMAGVPVTLTGLR